MLLICIGQKHERLGISSLSQIFRCCDAVLWIVERGEETDGGDDQCKRDGGKCCCQSVVLATQLKFRRSRPSLKSRPTHTRCSSGMLVLNARALQAHKFTRLSRNPASAFVPNLVVVHKGLLQAFFAGQRSTCTTGCSLVDHQTPRTITPHKNLCENDMYNRRNNG